MQAVVGKKNKVQAANIKTEGFVGHNVDSKDPLPKMKVRAIEGDENEVIVSGNIETIGVRSNVKEGDSSVRYAKF